MSKADIVVIGAGSVGANVAYRLAERGAKVTVLEAGAPGGGTSGTSFAWTNSFHKTPRDYHELNTASMAEHLSLVVELGGGDWHKQEGALAWEQEPLGRARRDEVATATGLLPARARRVAPPRLFPRYAPRARPGRPRPRLLHRPRKRCRVRWSPSRQRPEEPSLRAPPHGDARRRTSGKAGWTGRNPMRSTPR